MPMILNLANVRVAIAPCFPETLADYRPYQASGEPDFTVSVTQADLETERSRLLQSAQDFSRRADLFTLQALDNQSLYHQIAGRMPDFGAMLVHGSAIMVDGGAYLFAGNSGAGKSTHARLWREYFGEKAAMINDDHPLLDFKGPEVLACGSPWNGKHRLGNPISAPLRAVCFIQKGPENRLSPLPEKRRFPLMMQQCYPSREGERMVKVLDFVGRIVAEIPIFTMECNLQVSAAKAAWDSIQEALQRRNNECG